MKTDYTLIESIFECDINITNAVGYCPYHKGYLTRTQMKRVRCLEKRCQYFERTNHPFWIYYDKKKKEKKNERNNRKQIQGNK